MQRHPHYSGVAERLFRTLKGDFKIRGSTFSSAYEAVEKAINNYYAMRAHASPGDPVDTSPGTLPNRPPTTEMVPVQKNPFWKCPVSRSLFQNYLTVTRFQ
jgi:hypothetical protein